MAVARHATAIHTYIHTCIAIYTLGQSSSAQTGTGILGSRSVGDAPLREVARATSYMMLMIFALGPSTTASRRLHVPRHFFADRRDEMVEFEYLRAGNLPPAPEDTPLRALHSIATPSGPPDNVLI